MAVFSPGPNLAHQIHADAVTAQSKKSTMPQAQYAKISPGKINGEGKQSISKVFAHERHGIGAHMEHARYWNNQIQRWDDNHGNTKGQQKNGTCLIIC